MKPVTIYPIPGLPEVGRDAPLAELVLDAIDHLGLELTDGDVIVVTQKIVSKAEGHVVDLKNVQPSRRADEIAARISYDPRHVQVILDESVRIVREAPRVLIAETRHGFVCANAGVDRSNTGGQELAVLLPEDPDGSAQKMAEAFRHRSGKQIGVVISDSFGRPWREGQVNLAIGAAGVTVMRDYRGERDSDGYQLQGTELAVADELAAAAELVMGKLDRVPVALVRGANLAGDGSVRQLLRDPATDLFR
ncbi:MAG TPA: coenzyme F420-0:L-glutamate ligase [Candidatus Dormibacteraeota bacterium]